MLLSFVIPAYNCSSFIGDCLDSILRQGLQEENYEVIVIDDGSTDNTTTIVSVYCERYPNIKLFSQSHSGVGAARNKGLMHAQGQYVHFMDADDRLLPGGMGNLFNNYVIPLGFPDVVSFWSRTVDKHYKNDEWDVIRPNSLIHHGDIKEYGLTHGIGFSVWTQLISRALINNNNLRFSDHIIGEDMLFMLHLYALRGVSLAVTNLNIYRYQVHENSAMNMTSKDYASTVLDSLMDLSDRIGELNGDYPEAILESRQAMCRQWAYTRLCSAHLSYHEMQDCLNIAKERRFFNVSAASSRPDRIINIMVKSTLLSYVFAYFYGNFFIPWIKPWIKRN